MNEEAFEEIWRARRDYDERPRREFIHPFDGGSDSHGLRPRDYMVYVAKNWRLYVIDEMYADNCNSRVYHVEADSPTAFHPHRRMVYICLGLVPLKQCLQLIDDDAGKGGGLHKYRATSQRVDDGTLAYQVEFDLDFGAGAYDQMRQKMVSGNVRDYRHSKKRSDVDRFYKNFCNPNVKGH